MTSTIRTWNDPILKQVCDPIAPGEDVRDLMASMEDVCRRLNGVGLAAPQVGEAKRVIFTLVDRSKGQGRFFINPVIIEHSPVQTTAPEGCLSYPGVQKKVGRWTSIVVAYVGRDGTPREEKFHGFASRVMQHEIDHLDGICRVGSSKRQLQLT